jgi:hypothetical protein
MSSKLREALERSTTRLKGVADCCPEIRHLMQSQIEENDAALAEPLRNCDVGTAEEQYQRWDKYCNSFGTQCDKCDLNCNVHFDLTAKCFAHWAQMPYKKEGEQ